MSSGTVAVVLVLVLLGAAYLAGQWLAGLVEGLPL